MYKMNITLKDGSVMNFDGPVSVLDVAKQISEGLARMACAAEVNGEVVDLRTIVSEDSELSILTFNDEKVKMLIDIQQPTLWHKQLRGYIHL